MSAGRSPTDAVWRQAVVAERASNELKHVLVMLWDLKECYENVGHEDLVQQAMRCGFPAAGLRAAICMYRVTRALMLDGAVSQQVCPRMGHRGRQLHCMP